MPQHKQKHVAWAPPCRYPATLQVPGNMRGSSRGGRAERAGHWCVWCQNVSTTRRQAPLCSSSKASLMRSNLKLCVTYLSSRVPPAMYSFTSSGTCRGMGGGRGGEGLGACRGMGGDRGGEGSGACRGMVCV